MKLLFVFLLLFSVQSFAEMNCEVSKKISKNSGSELITIKLEPQTYPSGQTVHRGEIENMYFSVRSEAENEYLAIISEGPKYTHGTTVRSGFTNDNKMRISIVFQKVVYSLVCLK